MSSHPIAHLHVCVSYALSVFMSRVSAIEDQTRRDETGACVERHTTDITDNRSANMSSTRRPAADRQLQHTHRVALQHTNTSSRGAHSHNIAQSTSKQQQHTTCCFAAPVFSAGCRPLSPLFLPVCCVGSCIIACACACVMFCLHQSVTLPDMSLHAIHVRLQRDATHTQHTHTPTP